MAPRRPSIAGERRRLCLDMRRSVVPALALFCACARTPPAAPDIRALNDAAFRDLRCPDALSAIKPSQPRPDFIQAVALAGQTAYALSQGGRLWIWDGKEPARLFDPAHFVALARDGSVAVTRAPEGEEGARLEVRSLPSNQSLDHLLLKDGGVPIAVSSIRAVLRVRLPRVRCDDDNDDDVLCGGTVAWQPPTSEIAHWDFSSGAAKRESLAECKQASFGADGRSFACLNNDEDVISWAYPILLAPEWAPPPDPHNEELPLHWQRQDQWLTINSLHLGGDNAIYVTYRALNIYIADRGLAGHHGWRLERWTPDPAHPGEGKLSRLAESPDSLCTEVLAVSGGGGLIVLGGSQHALTVRRAPRYAPEPMAIERAIDAVVSADGTRILTGHVDGHLRLWDARSLALLSTSKQLD
jgi:hypothetical protein